MVNTYKIFQHPNGSVDAVKQGWSWPAFFFSFIWAVFKKMYLTGAALFLFSIIISTIVAHMRLGIQGEMLLNMITIVISIIFGQKGNEWREALLYKKGYDDKGLVEANSPQAALARFYQRM